MFNRTGTVQNNLLGTVRNYGSIFFPGSNYENNIVPYHTASLVGGALGLPPPPKQNLMFSVGY